MPHVWLWIDFDIAQGIARFVFDDGFERIYNKARLCSLDSVQDKQENKGKREMKKLLIYRAPKVDFIDVKKRYQKDLRAGTVPLIQAKAYSCFIVADTGFVQVNSCSFVVSLEVFDRISSGSGCGKVGLWLTRWFGSRSVVRSQAIATGMWLL